MSSQDIFDKNWSDIHIQAITTRVQSIKQEDGDTKVLSKKLFDDLVMIVDVVNRVNGLTHGIGQIIIEPTVNGYQIQVKDKLTCDVTAEGRTVIEALLHGLLKKEANINALLQ